jgi:hypothetical protein
MGTGYQMVKQLIMLKEKLELKFQLDRAFITFKGNVEIDGLYLEDKAAIRWCILKA